MAQQIAWGLLFGAIGILPAFFLVFVTIFSDAGAASEYVMAFGMIVVAYGLVGLLAGYVMHGWQAGLWVSAAAVLIAAWYTTREPGRLGLHALVVLVALAAACSGAAGGAAWRAKRR